MSQKTVLNDTHRALGAKMVDFGGWDMPIHYGSQIDEHHQVRRDAGMFDVSHMTVVDLTGARDTLRLEAGMNLYGQDMDEAVSPFEAALAWTVVLDEGRDFIGRAALEAQQAAGTARQMVGLVMDEKGVLRHGQKVVTANGEGEILSGTFSPSIGKAIAFARIPAGAPGDVRVDIRGREVPVRVVRFPFVRDNTVQPGI